MMEIIGNERGGSKLCFEGYMYTKKYASANRVRWECSFYGYGKRYWNILA